MKKHRYASVRLSDGLVALQKFVNAVAAVTENSYCVHLMTGVIGAQNFPQAAEFMGYAASEFQRGVEVDSNVSGIEHLDVQRNDESQIVQAECILDDGSWIYVANWQRRLEGDWQLILYATKPQLNEMCDAAELPRRDFGSWFGKDPGRVLKLC